MTSRSESLGGGGVTIVKGSTALAVFQAFTSIASTALLSWLSLVAAYVVFCAPSLETKLTRARSEIATLRNAAHLSMLRESTELPGTLSSSVLDDTGIDNDPWGRPYLIVFHSTAREPLVLSAGPDGMHFTEDDLRSDGDGGSMRSSSAASPLLEPIMAVLLILALWLCYLGRKTATILRRRRELLSTFQQAAAALGATEPCRTDGIPQAMALSSGAMSAELSHRPWPAERIRLRVTIDGSEDVVEETELVELLREAVGYSFELCQGSVCAVKQAIEDDPRCLLAAVRAASVLARTPPRAQQGPYR